MLISFWLFLEIPFKNDTELVFTYLLSYNLEKNIVVFLIEQGDMVNLVDQMFILIYLKKKKKMEIVIVVEFRVDFFSGFIFMF